MSVSGVGNSSYLQQIAFDDSAMERFLDQARAKKKEAEGSDPQTRLAWLATAVGAAGEVQAPQSAAPTQTAEAVAASASPEKSDAARNFLDYARMSIPERIRAKYLEDNGLTEESLAELDEKLRKKIEEEIRQKIEDAVKKDTGKSTGGIADLVA